ncbi:stalk domain-containing protein [Lysinibacillus sp. KU-BSD001]|uniref:stalk domain-containing protein n=1 Tax=Lysinibacillus sp. KU-BSD001 TaxID=3141328 RepID=UPI0036E42E98
MKRIFISTLIPASLLLSSSISAELSDETNTNLIPMEEVHSEEGQTEVPVLKDESTSDKTESSGSKIEENEKEILSFIEDPSLSILVNEDKVSFDHVPVVAGDYTLVPYELTFLILGAEISWDEISQTITATKDDKKLELTISSQTAKINDEEVEILVPATIIDSEILVPIEWLSEVFEVALLKSENTINIEIY